MTLIEWCFFILHAFFFGLLCFAILSIASLRSRLDRLAKTAPPSSPPMPSPSKPSMPNVSGIIQSREFTDAVRAHVLFAMQSAGTAPAAPTQGDSRKTAEAVPAVPPPPTALTEMEKGMLADLLAAAALRVEVAGADAVCTLLLPEVNRQFQQDYAPEHCEGLARKLIALSRKDAHPLLAKGEFIRVRNFREGVTAIDLDPKSVGPLRASFLS